MSLRVPSQFRSGIRPFNMTPLIDIVFLLIIFFLVVSQFIEAENFPVTVPDDCEFAQSDADSRRQVTTVTVMKTTSERSDFAVGSEKIAVSSYADIADKLAQLIDARLKDMPADHRVVTLRIDKDVRFAEYQYALAGVAASSATDIKLAALKDKRPGSQ
ncbi:MAG TPA: biopolymer transporter ExbD [Phycisphaerales bacterium]|nr:biopolymer transporter ExbD [Phycisphaerales bacterium]